MAYDEKEVLRLFRQDMQRSNYCATNTSLIKRQTYDWDKDESNTTPYQMRARIAYRLQKRGWLMREIAEIFCVSASTIHRMLDQARWQRRYEVPRWKLFPR